MGKAGAKSDDCAIDFMTHDKSEWIKCDKGQ